MESVAGSSGTAHEGRSHPPLEPCTALPAAVAAAATAAHPGGALALVAGHKGEGVEVGDPNGDAVHPLGAQPGCDLREQGSRGQGEGWGRIGQAMPIKQLSTAKLQLS